MQNLMKCVGIGALCLLALAGTQATRAADDEPVALHQSLKVKDTVQYKSDMKIEISGSEVTVEGNRTYTVKEIKDNGDIVLLVTDLGGKVIVEEQFQEVILPARDIYDLSGKFLRTEPPVYAPARVTVDPIPAASPITITQNKYGKILTFKPEREDHPSLSTPAQHLLALVDRIILPDKPVKPGDSWTTEVSNPAVKDKNVTIETTFVDMEKADGVHAWKIKQTLEADTDGGRKMTADVTALLDAATGQLIQADETIWNVPGIYGAEDWKGKIQRVKPDAEKKASPQKRLRP